METLDEDNAMAKLYKVESNADSEGLTADERQKRCKEISYSIIREFEKWLITVSIQTISSY